MSLFGGQRAVHAFVAAVLTSAAGLVLAAYAWGTWLTFAAALLAVGTAPQWLPGRVVALRMYLLTSINDGSDGSGEGVQVPNAEIDCDGFRQLYRSKAAGGRSVGAALSDLFWYFLSPGPEVHPEQVENGPKYDQIALVLRRLLSQEKKDIVELVQRHAQKRISSIGEGVTLVQLRDWFMPLFAGMYHELIFGDEPTPEVQAMIVKYAHNVIQTLKWCELRDMPARLEVTDYTLERVRAGRYRMEVMDGIDMPDEELALMLQGAFLNSGVVQSSEAMAHAVLALAQHPHVATELSQPTPEPSYVAGFVSECLRLWPLFGIAHRILTEEVELPSGRVLPAGTVVCFNYPEYHSRGYDNPDQLDPLRWAKMRRSEANYLPFGMPCNRPCPAQRNALVFMETLVPMLAKVLDFSSPVLHSRSLPGRGLCAIARRRVRSPRKQGGENAAAGQVPRLALLAWDQVDNIMRSIRQLGCAFVIVRDAKKLKLCQRFFDGGEQLLPFNQVF
eukprot:Hpha_TRINITY_DN15431_c1_g5::TRINITY_DN15431_c1_g5_i1::g.174109::m.174109